MKDIQIVFETRAFVQIDGVDMYALGGVESETSISVLFLFPLSGDTDALVDVLRKHHLKEVTGNGFRGPSEVEMKHLRKEALGK